MQIHITGQHLSLTPALEAYVREKLERIDRHSAALSARVVLSLDGPLHRAEATIHLPGEDIHAAGEEETMYAAIDGLVDRLSRQQRKLKTRRLARRHEDTRLAL